MTERVTAGYMEVRDKVLRLLKGSLSCSRDHGCERAAAVLMTEVIEPMAWRGADKLPLGPGEWGTAVTPVMKAPEPGVWRATTELRWLVRATQFPAVWPERVLQKLYTRHGVAAPGALPVIEEEWRDVETVRE